MKISFKRSTDTLLEKIKPNKTHTNHIMSEYLIIFLEGYIIELCQKNFCHKLFNLYNIIHG